MKKKNQAEGSTLTKKRYVTPIEYVSIAMSRIGGMFATTLTGTLATTFLHELYFGTAGVSSDDIADIMAVQTTLTTIAGILVGLISGVLVQKWKTKLGHYRQWYFINLIPMFALTCLYFWIPSGWTVSQLTWWRYGVALAQTIFNAFNTLSQNIVQVVSPDPKEKKTIATCWQLFYYIGYGGAYLAEMVYGKLNSDKSNMYMTLAVVSAVVSAIGNLMCGIFCKERIEFKAKEKQKLTKDLLGLWKYRNYRAYQYFTFANAFATLGKFSTYLAAITVGSSNNLLLTLPTAAGTVVGNVITAKISKKYEPTKLIRFCGFFTTAAAVLIFATAIIESMFDIMFFDGWTKWFFYVFYFMFGIGIGISELSTTHFTVEFYDYLEWQTGKRMEAVQGIIPNWIGSGLNWVRDLMIPYLLAWVGYKSSTEGDLLETMKAEPREDWMKTCIWVLAFLVFSQAICIIIKALSLKFFYNVEGETKQQMYKDLEVIRAKRDAELAGVEYTEAPAEDAPAEPAPEITE